MKTFTSILITGLLIVTTTFAQNSVNSSNMRDGVKVTRDNIKGSPFFTEKWVSGYGINSDGNKTNSLLLNYDLFGDQVVYKDASGQVLSMLDADLSGFVITTTDKTQIFSKTNQFEFVNGDTPKMAYVNVYDGASRNILVEYYKELDDPNESGWTSSNNNTLNAEYKDKMKVYVATPEGKYAEIKLKNKALLSLYPSNAKLKNYLKNNKIKDLDDLDRAFKFIDSNQVNK